MDVHSKEVRSYNMSRIKSSETKPEEITRKYLFSRGLRYRKNVKTLPGKPDIVLTKYRTIVFVNGCFWHGHNKCKGFAMPKSNVGFWRNKIEQNIRRDKKVYDKLQDMGWNVLVVWECGLKNSTRNITLEYLYQNIIRNVRD